MAYHGISWHIMAYHGISWHIMASGCNIHAPILQVEGETMEELQRELEAGRFREIPGDSGRFREIPGDPFSGAGYSWLLIV